jgi:hypothetical protein
MAEPSDEPRIVELEALRAPRRDDAQMRRAKTRILAAAETLLARRRCPDTSWDILARWARPGLVAASIAALLLLAAYQLGGGDRGTRQPVALDEVLATSESGSVPEMLLAINEPDADAVLAAALRERNGGSPEDTPEGGEQR